MNEVGYEKFC